MTLATLTRRMLLVTMAATGCQMAAAPADPGPADPRGPKADDPGGAPSLPSLRYCTDGSMAADLPTVSWNRWQNAIITAADPWHSARDVLAVPGDAVTVFGKFAYGPTSKDLEGERIEVWIDDCAGGYRLAGTAITNSDGRIALDIAPADIPGIGIYGLYFRVMGDSSAARATLRVFPRGTSLMVFDIDATLTTDDFELIHDIFAELFEPLGTGDYVPAARAGAADITALRAMQGYPLVFLTGRPYELTDISRDWLADEGIAPGTLMLAQSIPDALPTDSGVGDYKAAYLRELTDMGFVLEAAYGNAATDIYAYELAAIAKDRTFILGQNGGESGTVDLGDDYLDHIPDAAAEPAADQPFTW